VAIKKTIFDANFDNPSEKVKKKIHAKTVMKSGVYLYFFGQRFLA
jgi:hypothetical protein